MTTSTTLNWSAGDIAAAQQTLARVTEDVVHVMTLTDEEVVILDGLQHDQLVPTPWLDAQEGADRSLVGRVALRSLLARGLVVPSDEGRPAGSDGAPQVAIEAVAEVTGPLVLRRTAHAICGVERSTGLGKHWVYLYLHDDDRVLEEEVAASGHHSFSVYPLAVLPDRLAAFVDPPSSALLDGRSRTFSADEAETVIPQLEELQGAVAVSTLTGIVAGATSAEVVTVYSGPAGAFVLRGSRRGTDAPDVLTLTEVGPVSLRAVPLELLGR